MNNLKKQKNRGFSALLIVIIVSAAALIMSQNSAFLSIGELELGTDYTNGQNSLAVTEGCLESTMSEIRKNSNYGLSGTININILDGVCQIDVVDGGGGNRTIIAVGTKNNFSRSIEVQLTVSNRSITINNWQEISN